MSLNRTAALFAAHAQLGKPYLFGAKWNPANPTPNGPIDCSGLVIWTYGQGGVIMPDGSYNQFQQCDSCDDPLPGDLGFFRSEAGEIDHVGIVYDDENMIEARGAPFNAVILRPRIKWEEWPRFTGYMRARRA